MPTVSVFFKYNRECVGRSDCDWNLQMHTRTIDRGNRLQGMDVLHLAGHIIGPLSACRQPTRPFLNVSRHIRQQNTALLPTCISLCVF